jgi:hypothetical protein
MSADPSILQAALIGYQHQRDQIDAKMAEIRRELSGTTAAPVKRVVSPAVRRRMAAGQRKRWADAKNAAGTPAQPHTRTKRRMSAAGRKRIAEATRKRWAAYRAEKAARAK